MEDSVKQIGVKKSASEIRGLFRKKEQSNLTVKEFCKLHQINKATFYNWHNKYGPKVKNPEKFVPVRFSDIASEPALFAEIELSAKLVVRLFHKVDPAYFKALL